MNADLERTLEELGPGCRAVVDRMVGAFDGAAAPADRVVPRRIAFWRRPALLVRPAAPAEPAVDAARSAYVLAYSPDAATVAAIVRTQHADGSWDNDFLTRQNAAALRAASGDAPRIAYRRAVRYLRAKGLAPLSDAELRARGDRRGLPPRLGDGRDHGAERHVPPGESRRRPGISRSGGDPGDL